MNRNYRMMKLVLVCLISLLSMALADGALATDMTPASRYEIGLRAGFGMATIGGDGSSTWDKTRTGVMGGAFARYAVTDAFSFEMGLAYVQKGGKADFAVMNDLGVQVGTIETTLELERIEVVPAVVFTIPVEGSVRPSLLGGISFAFGGSSNIKAEGQDTEDYSEVTESMNLGFVVGAELAYQLESARIFADFRYSRDFGSFHEAEIFEWINQVMSFGVGVGFGI